jgi:FRG domain
MRVNLDNAVYYASNIKKAVQVAKQLQKDGHYDIFRGQIRSLPIRPSIFRPGVDRDAAVERLKKFSHWIQSMPELSSMHRNLDAIMAVAQHYGLKTTLLDFTTNPQIAGFFASDGTLPPISDEEHELSCIICAKRSILFESWKEINARSVANGSGPLVRVLEIDVQNLWRLQAQDGLFIDVHVDPMFLEMYSFFFRIVFPYSGPYRSVQRESVYPSKRSHLELLFEEYTSHKNRIAGIARLEEMGFHRIPMSEKPFYGEPSSFKSGRLPPILASWKNTTLAPWRIEPGERHKDILSKNSIRINLKKGEEPVSFAQRVQKQIRLALSRQTHIRQVSIRWSIKDANGKNVSVNDESKELLKDGSCPQIECKLLLALLWDGIRRLPYSDDQVAECVANYLFLVRYGYEHKELIFGKMMGIELAAIAAINRAMASEADVLACVHFGFLDLVTATERIRYKSASSPASEILGILVDPRRLFEFQKFADMFVRQVIPTQLWIRSEGTMIVFSPARVDVFGNS